MSMDSLTRHEQAPPPPSFSNTSFPVLAFSVLGILTTAILLVSYYLFVTKCRPSWRHSDVIARFSSTLSRRRSHRREEPFMLYTTAAETTGLSDSAIRSIPTFRFGQPPAAAVAPATRSSLSFHECAVCLNEFQEDERLRLLPNCFHVFHIDCIDIWLQTNSNCPVCRSEITTETLIHLPVQVQAIDDAHVAIQVTEDGNSLDQQESLRREVKKFSSMGDEFIDNRPMDERFCIQPLRRSFSMDSCCDRQLYLSIQEMLQQKNSQLERVAGNGDGSGGGGGSSSGRIRRSFFSFGHGRSSRKAVLPIHIDL